MKTQAERQHIRSPTCFETIRSMQVSNIEELLRQGARIVTETVTQLQDGIRK